MSYMNASLEIQEEETEVTFGPTIVKNKLSPKERMELKAGFFIGQLHGMIDDFDLKSTELPDFYNFMRKNDIAGKLAELIRQPFHPILEELQKLKGLRKYIRSKKNSYSEDDLQLIEGYEYLSTKELDTLISLYDNIIASSNAIVENAKRTRKKPVARKKKGKPASKIVSKMKYLQEDTDLMLQSDSPEKIIGAKLLFVYNKVYNTVTMYFAETIEGLTVKGTSISSFSESKSKSYKLGRKPDIIKEILEYRLASKASDQFRELNLKETRISARMNDKCLILKTIH